jgi:hypothetical protein
MGCFRNGAQILLRENHRDDNSWTQPETPMLSRARDSMTLEMPREMKIEKKETNKEMRTIVRSLSTGLSHAIDTLDFSTSISRPTDLTAKNHDVHDPGEDKEADTIVEKHRAGARADTKTKMLLCPVTRRGLGPAYERNTSTNATRSS